MPADLESQDLSGDIDPQSAIAAQGFSQLGDMALQSQAAQNIITGKGLTDFNNMVNAAIGGDPDAQLGVAQHGLMTAASVAPSVTDSIANGLSHAEHAELVGSTQKIAPDVIRIKGKPQPPEETFTVGEGGVKNWGKAGAKFGPPKYAEGGEITPSESPQSETNTPAFIPDNQFKPDDEPTQQTQSGGGADFVSDADFVPDEEKYGTVGQLVKTGLEGAAQGVVGPLAPALEQAAGVNPEDIRLRAETNPIVHGASEIGGLIAPAALTAGASALERLGVAGAAEAIPAASKFTQLGALNAIQEKLGITAGETLASKIGTGAAKAAIDNMLLAGSDETSKMILNDPNTSAQTAIANIGLSGLLGAALGGSTSGVAGLWQAKVGDKTSKVINDFKGRIQEHLDNPDPVVAMTNELKQYHGDITGIADEVYGPNGLKAKDIETSMPDMHEGISNQIQGTQDKIESLVQKMADKPDVYPARLTNKLQGDLTAFTTKVTEPSVTPGDLFNATQDLKQSLQAYAKYDKFVKPTDEAYDFVRDSKTLAHDLRTSLEDTDVWGDAAKRQQVINNAFKDYLPALKDFEKKFTSEIGGNREVDATKVQTYLNQVGKPNATLKQSMLQNFLTASEKYKRVIDQTHLNLGLDSPIKNSPMNVTLSSLEKKTLGSKLADAFINRGLTDAGSGVLGGGLGASLAHAVGLPSALGAIIGHGALAPFFKSVLPALANSMLTKDVSATGFKAATDYGLSVTKGADLLTKASANLFKDNKDILPESFVPTDKDRMKLDTQLQKIQQNPDLMLNKANPIQGYMPANASAMDQATGNAIQYLNSLRPNVGKQSPLDSKPVPSEISKAAFTNALQLAEQPLVIIDRAKQGTLTSKDLMAVNAMYPNLLNNIKAKLITAMTNHISKGSTVPYKTRIGLSLLMGQHLDSTMAPMSIIAAQPMAQPPQPPQQAPKKSKGTPSSPALQKIPTQYQTPTQARYQRQQKQ
jgi:hypothetical protein